MFIKKNLNWKRIRLILNIRYQLNSCNNQILNINSYRLNSKNILNSIIKNAIKSLGKYFSLIF